MYVCMLFSIQKKKEKGHRNPGLQDIQFLRKCSFEQEIQEAFS